MTFAQINDLTQGVVLVPIPRTDNSLALASQTNAKSFLEQEEQRALKSFADIYNFGQVLFYYESDSAAIAEGSFKGKIFNKQGDSRDISELPQSQIFLAQIAPPMTIHPEIISQRMKRKMVILDYREINERGWGNDVGDLTTVKGSSSVNATGTFLRKYIEKGDWTGNLFDYPVDYTATQGWVATQDFHDELTYFANNSPRFESLRIVRWRHSEYRMSKKMSYFASIVFSSRIHPNQSREKAITDAIEHLNFLLKTKKDQLTPKKGAYEPIEPTPD